MGALSIAEPISLRLREASDRDAIERIATEAFGEYTLGDTRHTVRQLDALPTIVACRGGRVVGFASVERAGRIAALPAIAVAEHERSNGVGRRLLAAAEKLAVARGARVMTLHTAQANVAAFELFARSGYRITRRIPRFYRGVFGACEMAKRLAPR